VSRLAATQRSRQGRRRESGTGNDTDQEPGCPARETCRNRSETSRSGHRIRDRQEPPGLGSRQKDAATQAAVYERGNRRTTSSLAGQRDGTMRPGVQPGADVMARATNGCTDSAPSTPASSLPPPPDDRGPSRCPRFILHPGLSTAARPRRSGTRTRYRRLWVLKVPGQAKYPQ